MSRWRLCWHAPRRARGVTSGLNGALSIRHDVHPALLGTRPSATFATVSRKRCSCCVRYLGPSFLCTQPPPTALFHQLDEPSCLTDRNAAAYCPSSLDFTSFEGGLHTANLPSFCPGAEINLFHLHCHETQTHAAQRLHSRCSSVCYPGFLPEHPAVHDSRPPSVCRPNSAHRCLPGSKPAQRQRDEQISARLNAGLQQRTYQVLPIRPEAHERQGLQTF